jgi:hypothetical protein
MIPFSGRLQIALSGYAVIHSDFTRQFAARYIRLGQVDFSDVARDS